MKFHPFAAAAMLLASGSALAYAPHYDMNKHDLSAVAGKGAELASFKADYDMKADHHMKAESAAYFADGKPMVVPAATVTWDKADPMVSGEPDPDLDLSETSIDENMPHAPAMGGPLDDMAATDTTPRPATQNYPACQPGPGDDSCIQLYEPGVETALASWTAPTGGVAEPGEAMAAIATTESLNAESLALASAQVDAIRADGTALASVETTEPAVGGPYEPVADEELAMNGDFEVDEELGESKDMAEI